MEQGTKQWLPHLTEEVVADARGWNLDAYVIALEGWRRGLTLKWHTKDSEKFKEIKTWFVDTPGRLFSLSSEERTHYFFRTRGDKVTNEAVEIGGDKEKTKQILKQANIPVPEGKRFKEDVDDEEIIKYARNSTFPLVLKPTDGSFGKGVITNIQDEEQLQEWLKYVRHEQKFLDLIVEQHIEGEDHRIYVVGDKAVAAMKRIPANVIGDGVSTIQQLVDQKNEDRKHNPRLISCLIKIDQEMTSFIEHQGYTLDSVLNKGERLFLTSKANISIGGDPINVTEQLPKEVMDTAVRAIQAIPGLAHGSVDLIINPNKEPDESATVIEVNPTSQIGGLLFPVEGKASDVPAAIIDYYFPETEGQLKHNILYFDFKKVLSPITKNTANTTVVSSLSPEKVYVQKFYIKLEKQDLTYQQNLRQVALDYGLMGLIEKNDNEGIFIIIAGLLNTISNFKINVLESDDNINYIKELSWEGFVKAGFEIKDAKKEMVDVIYKKQKLVAELKIKRSNLEKEYKGLLNSTSWKITSPLRKITGLFK